MHVLQIIPHYPSEAFLKEHINALVLKNNTLRISWFYLSSPNYGEFNAIGKPLSTEIGAFRKNHFTTYHRLRKKFKSLSVHDYCKYLNLEQVKNISPDILHFQFGWSLDSFSWIINSYKCPYCISFRGSDVFVEPIASPDYLKRIKLFVQQANGIHVVSESVKKKVIELFKPSCEVDVIHTPIHNNWESSNSTQKKIDIVSIGRLHWVKDYQELFLAFKIFKQRFPEAKLKMIGDGPDKYKLQFLSNKLGIDKNVVFLGKLDKDQLKEELYSVKLFVLTSLSEGFPNALLESLLAGINCIVPNDLSLDSVFNKGEIVTYQKFDFNDLAKVMMDQYEEASTVSLERIEKSKKIICNEFSFDSHQSKFIQFYQKLLV